jgi:hypothetical protein
VSKHFMNPAVGRHLQGDTQAQPGAVENSEAQTFSGRLHINSPDGQEQIHHFSAQDHDGLLDQIHQFLQGGSEHQSLTDLDAQEAGGADSSSGGVHAHSRDSGFIPD